MAFDLAEKIERQLRRACVLEVTTFYSLEVTCVMLVSPEGCSELILHASGGKVEWSRLELSRGGLRSIIGLMDNNNRMRARHQFLVVE